MALPAIELTKRRQGNTHNKDQQHPQLDTALAIGIRQEDAWPLRDAPSTKVTPRSGVGDAASAALNAAALQTLSRQGRPDHEYRVYRGRIVPTQQRRVLNGVASHDISYIADDRTRPGAGARARVPSDVGGRGGSLSPPPADPISQALVQPVSGRRARAKAPSEALPVPSSRAEAVAAADQLRRGLDELSNNGSLEEEMDLWKVRFRTLAHLLHEPLSTWPIISCVREYNDTRTPHACVNSAGGADGGSAAGAGTLQRARAIARRDPRPSVRDHGEADVGACRRPRRHADR